MTKKNNYLYYIIIALVLLSVLMLMAVLQILPNNIPIQHSFDNRIIGWGSKYTLFIFLFLELMITGIFCGSGFLIEKLATSEEEKKQSQVNRRLLNAIGLCVLLMVIIYLIIAIINAYSVTMLKKSPLINIISVACCAIGILYIVLGIIVRKSKRNVFLGLRTKLSLKNDFNWKKAQRTSSFVFFFGGCIMILGSFFIPNSFKLIWLVLVSLFVVIMSIILSRIVLKKAENVNEDVL